MLHITHVITGLNVGGAEMMLYKLLAGMDRRRFRADVVSLTPPGALASSIEALDIPVRSLGLSRGTLAPAAVFRFAAHVRATRPSLVQSWMYHADLLASLSAPLCGRPPVVWDVQNSNLSPRTSKRLTRWTAALCARLSPWLVERIVCCSEEGLAHHAALGYAREKLRVIPNGFDLGAFRPDPSARLALRRELGLADEVRLIGLVARFDPQKDHANFFEAASLLAARRSDVHFVLCGDGVEAGTPELARRASAAPLAGRVHLLGRRSDIPRLTAALDLATLSSAYGEAFPNVLGEAMACGVPCVATEVGDCGTIIGETGKVVAIASPGALAEAWEAMLALPEEDRQGLGAAARARVEAHYSLPSVVERYQDLYGQLAQAAPRRSSVLLSESPPP